MITELVSPIIAYAGILIGVLLGHMSLEELAEGKQYLRLVSKILIFLSLAIFGVYIFHVTGFWLLGLFLTLVSLLVFKYTIPLFVVYTILPFALFLPKIYSFVALSLLFVYGLCQGSLFIRKKMRLSLSEVITKTYIFFVAYVLVIILSLVI